MAMERAAHARVWVGVGGLDWWMGGLYGGGVGGVGRYVVLDVVVEALLFPVPGAYCTSVLASVGSRREGDPCAETAAAVTRLQF